MRLFYLLKSILQEIHEKGALVSFDETQKREHLFLLRHIPERGMEQTVLAEELEPHISGKKISETFYGYVLWIAGELMNNVFDHAQTLGKTLKGGVLAIVIDDKHIELAVGDLGIGIKASLEKNQQLAPLLADGGAAPITLALRENTSGWPYRRGNGLPDVLRIVMAGGGVLYVLSDEWLFIDGDGVVKKEERYVHHINTEETEKPFPGAIVAVELGIKDFDVPRRGKPKGKVLKLAEFGAQLSGRDKGQEAYEMLVRELINLPKDGALILDCTGVLMMNSSFGDQALGVLLENIKAGHFGAKKVYFTGAINTVVDLCLDRIAEIRGVEVFKV